MSIIRFPKEGSSLSNGLFCLWEAKKYENSPKTRRLSTEYRKIAIDLFISDQCYFLAALNMQYMLEIHLKKYGKDKDYIRMHNKVIDLFIKANMRSMGKKLSYNDSII